MRRSRVGRKLRKLFRDPQLFFDDALTKRIFRKTRRPLFLVERIQARHNTLVVSGRGVSGATRLLRTFDACTAILSDGKTEHRCSMRDVPRVDLKLDASSKQPGIGFRFHIDVDTVSPGRYELHFSTPGHPRFRSCFRNIRTDRLQQTHKCGNLWVTTRVRREHVGVGASKRCKLVVIVHSVPRVHAYNALGLLLALIRFLFFFNRYEFSKVLHFFTQKRFEGRRIILLGERGDTAQDNGFHLFKYIRTQHPDEEAYYVLEKSAPDWDKVASLGNIIAKNSLRHWLYLLHARVMVNAYDVDSYMLPRFFDRQEFLRRLQSVVRYKRVFLQHGIIHNDVARSMHCNNTGYDLVLCSAPPEHKYLNTECQYDGWAKLTGLPRFDALKSTPAGEPFILLMPTWRRWLVQPSYRGSNKQNFGQFLESEYFKFYNGLLNHPGVIRLLETANLRIKFYLHYEMQPFARLFEPNPYVDILSKEESDVQNLLTAASALVTDYSSVFFDCAFMGKPIIHCLFDENRFFGTQYRRSYFDIRTTGFGEVCCTHDEFINALRATIESGLQPAPEYAARVESFFRNVKRGGSCSARAYEEVVLLL